MFNQVYEKLQEADPYFPYNWLISPDKKWLLFCFNAAIPYLTDPEVHHSTKAVMLSLDGAQQIAFTKTDLDSAVAWMPDSYRWVEITRTGACIHSLHAPQQSLSEPIMFLKDRQGHTATLGDNSPSVSPKGHFISTFWDEHPLSSIPVPVWLADYDLLTNPITVQLSTVMLPSGAELDGLALSPDGKEVAWMLSSIFAIDASLWNRDQAPSGKRRYMNETEDICIRMGRSLFSARQECVHRIASTACWMQART